MSVIGGCTPFHHPWIMDLDVPDGPREFKAGWWDGCRSALSVKKTANSMPYNVTFGNGIWQHDSVYQSAWATAFTSCTARAGNFAYMHPFMYAPLD